MTVELIAESEWVLKGYWTKLRTPVNKTGDIDVLAYCPKRRHLVVTEVRAHGKKTQVYAGKFGAVEHDPFVGPMLKHIEDGCAGDADIFGFGAHDVSRLTVQLVSNWVIEPSYRDEANAVVLEAVKARVPADRIEACVMLDTTLEVFARVIESERSLAQGKRYGHPILDLAREINRYLNPNVAGVGRSSSTIDSMKQAAIAPLWRALTLH